MSRTYNTKHDFDKMGNKFEFPHGYHTSHIDIQEGGDYYHDVSYTTFNDNQDRWRKCSRHPNKHKKRGSLGREFTSLGMSGTRYWRNRFGEVYDKSSRNHLIKREMNQTRRHRLKNDTQNEINRELNEY